MKTLEEFENWYATDKFSDFQFELAKSSYIDYHYEFIEMSNPFDRGI